MAVLSCAHVHAIYHCAPFIDEQYGIIRPGNCICRADVVKRRDDKGDAKRYKIIIDMCFSESF